MRLEDTDEERSDEAYTQDIFAGLHWLGLNWDEGPDIGGPYPPYRQTQKIDHYNNVANQLIAKGFAYLAYETPEELAAIKNSQEQSVGYDNRGRNLSQEQIDQYASEGRVPSIRFKIEVPRVVSWHDKIKGEIAIDTADLGGDMVIVKSNGVAVYNFAVVVDDIDMKMTHVIRGEDHIHNTAKQILLYEALGHKPPEFAHAALIFDTDRQKLSKRKHGEAVHVDRYRLDGYMPEAMVNYLSQMSWTHPEGLEIFSLEEAAKVFDLNKVSKSPAIFDVPRLNWFNGQYIRSLPLDEIVERAKPFLESIDTSGYSHAELKQILASVREGVTVLKELPEAAKFYFDSTVAIDDEVKGTVLAAPSAGKVIESTLQNLGKMPWGDHAGCKAIIDGIGKELGVKGKELYWPLRAALSGKTSGPDLGSIISILGEQRVRSRLESSRNGSLCRSA